MCNGSPHTNCVGRIIIISGRECVLKVFRWCKRETTTIRPPCLGGRECNVCITVIGRHANSFTHPIVGIPLDYTKGVNPDILKSKASGGYDCILENLG